MLNALQRTAKMYFIKHLKLCHGILCVINLSLGQRDCSLMPLEFFIKEDGDHLKINVLCTAFNQLPREELITRELFDATMANNEGMGVLHKTLLDQLTNEVMRSALKKAVIRTVEEINK